MLRNYERVNKPLLGLPYIYIFFFQWEHPKVEGKNGVFFGNYWQLKPKEIDRLFKTYVVLIGQPLRKRKASSYETKINSKYRQIVKVKNEKKTHHYNY